MQRAREEKQTTWTTEDRLRKIAHDLLDTEKDYVRVSEGGNQQGCEAAEVD